MDREDGSFLWHERRNVLTFSITDLAEKVSCNCWKSNERCGKNKTVIRIKIAIINKEYSSELIINQLKKRNETDFNYDE